MGGARRSRQVILLEHVLHGRNSLGNVGYDGPLGTLGRTVRYRLPLIALDQL